MKCYVRLTIFLLALVFGLCNAFAQMTDDDIRVLQDRGKAEGWTFTVSKNPATQYPLEQITGFQVPADWRERAPFENSASILTLPSAFDWRTEVNGLPPIRDQRSCGSCWAFATVGAFECNIKIKDQTVVDLSEQWLVSCNQSGYTCNGGWWCHNYFLDMWDPCGGTGAVLEKDFPYKSQNGTCACPYPHEYFLDGWGYVGGQWSTPTISQMKQAIMERGPISVAICANNLFQAYGGGVFNGCTGGAINHAVVLVGWDDVQGTNGVWILRNSWGPWWGEGGYMRIPYGCQDVGYNATYISYRGRVAIQADTTMGHSPLPVNFSVGTALQVSSYSWDFGDGSSSSDSAPSHVYVQPGMYSVSLSTQCPDGLHQCLRSNLISVHADSLSVLRVTASAGQEVRVDISACNYLPLSEMIIPMVWAGPIGLKFDSFSTVGLRTAGLLGNGWPHVDPDYYQRGTFRVAPTVGQEQLPPGQGAVVSVYFHVSDYPTGSENSITIEAYDDGMNLHTPQFTASAGSYVPTITSSVVVLCKAGDVSSDGIGPDLTDLSYLVSYLTGGLLQLPNPANANINGIGVIDLTDLSTLVSYLTSGNPKPLCK